MEAVFHTFTGLPGRNNLVMLSCAPQPTRNVIYFQGDTQDFRAKMEERYEDIRRYKEWSLEDTHSILQKKFPNSVILLVRPSNTLRDIFSCFHNFVQSSIVGTPVYNTSHGAIAHLYALLNDCTTFIATEMTTGTTKEHLLTLPTVLIGFSKGCVVLNQILYELDGYISSTEHTDTPPAVDIPHTDSGVPGGIPAGLLSAYEAVQLSSSHHGPDTDNKEIVQFLNHITDIYWLDSGHSGESEAWITNPEILSTLVKLKAKVHVHVSPHQIACPSRPWIGEEEKLFVSTLRNMGGVVEERVHFNDQPRSFLNHFRILNEF